MTSCVDEQLTNFTITIGTFGEIRKEKVADERNGFAISAKGAFCCSDNGTNNRLLRGACLLIQGVEPASIAFDIKRADPDGTRHRIAIAGRVLRGVIRQ